MNMAWNRASPFICKQWRCFCNGNWGAAKEVTGSCTLIETRRSKFSLDCSQRQGQGTESSPEFQFNLREIDFVKVRSVKANLDEVCTAFDWLLKHEERVHTWQYYDG